MGKIYTAAEIAAEHIPEPGAHLEAAKQIIGAIKDHSLHEDVGLGDFEFSSITAGMVHGSSISGAATLRSDVDIVVLYHSGAGDTESLQAAHSFFKVIEQTHHVYIEANVLSTQDALSTNHKIDPLFLRALLQAEDNDEFSYGWPASRIEHGFEENDFSSASMTRCVRRYVGAKNASFARAIAVGSPDQYARFQRALELPKNLGRKVMGMLDDNFVVTETSGAQIVAGLKAFIDSMATDWNMDAKEGLHEDLDRLVERDHEYDHALLAATSGEIRLSTYETWVKANMRVSFEDALKVGNAMARLLLVYAFKESESEIYPIDGQGELFAIEEVLGLSDNDVY